MCTRRARIGGARAPCGVLAQVQGVGVAGQPAVAGQEPGQRLPLGQAEQRIRDRHHHAGRCFGCCGAHSHHLQGSGRSPVPGVGAPAINSDQPILSLKRAPEGWPNRRLCACRRWPGAPAARLSGLAAHDRRTWTAKAPRTRQRSNSNGYRCPVLTNTLLLSMTAERPLRIQRPANFMMCGAAITPTSTVSLDVIVRRGGSPLSRATHNRRFFAAFVYRRAWQRPAVIPVVGGRDVYCPRRSDREPAWWSSTGDLPPASSRFAASERACRPLLRRCCQTDLLPLLLALAGADCQRANRSRRDAARWLTTNWT
jgi:hypothetical protein